MEYLFVIQSASGVAAVKIAALTLPVAVTSLKIGVTHWRLRRERGAAACRMARSLVKAVGSGVLDFEAAPGRPHVSVFEFDAEEADMQLIPSPRSLVRSKPWWTDTLPSEEASSRIIRVFQLGPASDPDEKLLRGIPKGLIKAAGSLDAEEETTEPPASFDTTASLLSEHRTEPVNVIILPSVGEEGSLPSTKPIGRELCGFLRMADSIAEVPMAPLLPANTGRSTDPKQNVEIIGWTNPPQHIPADFRGLDPSAFPIRGFQRGKLRKRPVISVREVAVSGFIGPAVALPGTRLDEARKALPLRGLVPPIIPANAAGESGVQAEPFFITPPMRLPRCRYTVRQRRAVPLFLVPPKATLTQRCAEA